LGGLTAARPPHLAGYDKGENDFQSIPKGHRFIGVTRIAAGSKPIMKLALLRKRTCLST
jgi:hypothetical protein